jgi:hypothetical protein
MELVMLSTLCGSSPPFRNFGFKFFRIVTIDGTVSLLELELENPIGVGLGCGHLFPSIDAEAGDKLLSPR